MCTPALRFTSQPEVENTDYSPHGGKELPYK